MKKKLFMLYLSILAILTGYSQINKGSILFGTDLNFNLNNNKNASDQATSKYINRGVKISPNVGYFIANNLALGITPSFSFNTIKSVNESSLSNNKISLSTTTYQYAITSYARYYKMLGEKAATFVEANAGYVYSTLESEVLFSNSGALSNTSNSQLSSQGLTTGLNIGFTYFVSDKFALETAIKALEYTVTNDKIKSKSDFAGSSETSLIATDFNSGLNLKMSSINFGIKYFIRKG